MDTSIKAALDAFLASPDFEEGITGSTKAARDGGSYYVELFSDGTHRTGWSGSLGNKYESPGEIIQLPTLEVDPSALEEWQSAGGEEDEFLGMAFANEQADLEQQLQDALRA